MYLHTIENVLKYPDGWGNSIFTQQLGNMPPLPARPQLHNEL